jgi:hypothetical protein
LALYLAATTDKFSLITSAAATVDVHVSYADLSTSTFLPTGFGKQNTAITTATTTDVLAAPAASTVRTAKFISIRNKHASLSCDVTFQFNQNATLFELYKTTLRAGDQLTYTEGVWFYYQSAMVPVRNYSVTDQVVGASVTAALTGSNLAIPSTQPLAIGCVLRWLMTVIKSGAATAAMMFDVRYGTTGTTSDTSRFTGSTGTQTAVADAAEVEIRALVRGPISASCIVHHEFEMQHNLAATGFAATANVVTEATSSAFDITTAGLIAGLSLTTSTSHSITFKQITAEVIYPT